MSMRPPFPVLKNQSGPESGPESGMTMVEVIVTMGIAMVLIMGVMQMSNYANKAAKNVQISSEWSLMATQAQLLLQQETHCQSSLQGLALKTSGSTSMPQGLVFKMNGTDTPVTVAKVGDYGSYSIDKVELKTTGAPSIIKTSSGDQTLYTASLEISGKKRGQSLGGTGLRSIEIPLQIVTDSAQKVVGCYGKDLASAQACTDLGGMYVPTATPKCQGTGTGVSECVRFRKDCGVGNYYRNKCEFTCPAEKPALLSGIPYCQNAGEFGSDEGLKWNVAVPHGINITGSKISAYCVYAEGINSHGEPESKDAPKMTLITTCCKGSIADSTP